MSPVSTKRCTREYDASDASDYKQDACGDKQLPSPKIQRTTSPPTPSFHVDFETNVVPMHGKPGVKAVVSVDSCFWEALSSSQCDVDVMFAFDTSGSMHRHMDNLGDALVHFGKSADAAHRQNLHSARDSRIDLNFAFGVWNNTCRFPGLTGDHADVERLPFGYVPFGPAHEMGESTMLNIKSNFFKSQQAGSGTNMQGAIRSSLKLLKERRVAVHKSDPTRLQHLVVFTDGIPNRGQTKSSLTQLVHDEIGDDAVVVHMFVMGSSVDLQLAEALSVGTTKGCIAFADGSGELAEAFDSILSTITKSSIPFNLKIETLTNDKSSVSSTQVVHCGVLNRDSNYQALVDLDFGPQTDVGTHIVASIGLMTGTDNDAVPLAAMSCYAHEKDPLLSSNLAAPSDGYMSFVHGIELEKELNDKILNLVEAEFGNYTDDVNNVDSVLAKLDCLVNENAPLLTVAGRQRLNVVLKKVKRDAKRGKFNRTHSTPFSRRATLTATFSQSS